MREYRVFIRSERSGSIVGSVQPIRSWWMSDKAFNKFCEELVAHWCDDWMYNRRDVKWELILIK